MTECLLNVFNEICWMTDIHLSAYFSIVIQYIDKFMSYFWIYKLTSCWHNFPLSGNFPVKKAMVECFLNTLVDLPRFFPKNYRAATL